MTRETDPEAFRADARTWLAQHLGPNAAGSSTGLVDDSTTKAERMAQARAVQAQMLVAGYAGITFPERFGGQGRSLEYERVLREEAVGYALPNWALLGVSIEIVGRAVLAFGTEEQKLTYLPRILSGEWVFVQLLSEPSGGSDLAGLMMRADRTDKGFVLNGQKVWSSGAELADFGLCVARTNWDLPKRKGLTVFIVDMRAPGIEIRPIRQIDGEVDFCEEFFTDVFVPDSDIVGTIDDGWTVVRGWLEFEHQWAGQANTARRAPGMVAPLVELARLRSGGFDWQRDAIGRLHADISLHQQLMRRIRSAQSSGRLSPAHGGLLKISSDRLTQRRSELGLSLAGTLAVAWNSDEDVGAIWTHSFLAARGVTLGGGTDEIQHNNVGERVLGLPREPSTFDDIPFSHVPHN